MERLGQTWCRYFVFLLAARMYCGQNTCEVIPKNLTIELGSNFTVVYKAPFDSVCRNKLNAFSPDKVFWTLNSQKIEEIYYTHNSTYAAVTIVNFTLESGTVECHMYEQVLGGTIVHTQPTKMVVEPPKKPVGIHCVTNATIFFKQYTTCYWDEAGNSVNTTYKVIMLQKHNSGHCTSQHGQNHCRLSKHAHTSGTNMTVTVTAQNSVGNASATVHFNPWEITKYDPPKGVRVDASGLRVDWDQNNYGFPDSSEKCEVQCVEEGTNVKIISNKTLGERTIFVDDVKPCMRYTVAVRCAYLSDGLSLWSDWSTGTTVQSALNVNTVPFYFWGKILDQYSNKTRLVQLMWKGPPPICNAIDEYRLYLDSGSFKHLPTKHNTTILLNAADHEITIALYKNNTMLRNSSLKIPFTGKDLPPVQRPITTAQGGFIQVSWEAPSTPVQYYVVEWFTEHRHSWNRTQETSISFPGDLPYKLYTVTITPLYDDGPGKQSTLYTYAKQGAPAKVQNVRKIDADATWLLVGWEAVRPDQCCGFVVSYTVFYRATTKASEGPLNVTVNHTSQQVTLKDLLPSTTYQIHVQANSIDNSSDSGAYTCKTEAYGEAFISTLVFVAIGLILLLVIAVFVFMLIRKVVNLMVPNPQFSSMAMWAPEKSLKPLSSNNLGLDSYHKEKILLCHVDTEMDTKLDFPADTDSAMPQGDKKGSSTVSMDTSASRGQAESSGATVFYSLWECQTKSPDEAVKPIHQQLSQASPSLHNPYLDQMPIDGRGGLVTDRAQARSMSSEGKAVVESGERESLNLTPSATTYVTVDMLEGQKETKECVALIEECF